MTTHFIKQFKRKGFLVQLKTIKIELIFSNVPAFLLAPLCFILRLLISFIYSFYVTFNVSNVLVFHLLPIVIDQIDSKWPLILLNKKEEKSFGLITKNQINFFPFFLLFYSYIMPCTQYSIFVLYIHCFVTFNIH